MRYYLYIPALTTLIASCALQDSFNQEQATTEILRLHNLQRDYHFNKDSIAFADQLSDTYFHIYMYRSNL